MSEETIIEKIYEQYPQFQGISPEVKIEILKPDRRLLKKSKVYSRKAKPTKIKVFTFIRKIKLNNEAENEEILRVSADSRGNILKAVLSK